jgi:twinkle protein
MPKDCKDANDVLLRHGKAAVRRLALEAKPYPVSGLIAARDALPEVEYLYENGVERGASTGWLTVDKFYTVKVGEMTIVTGIPASGKSNVLDALAVNLARSHNWSFAVFSPENWPVQRHITTLLEKVEKKPFWNNRYASRMTPDDMSHGMQWLNDHFHFIIPEEETMSVDTILEKTRAAVLRHGVRGVIIDPWNEIEHDMNYAEREDQYISRALTQIRRFARFNGVHIWVVAHPRNLQKDKKTGKYKAPTMYEISGGAHWRNKADNGICVHRPDLNKSEVDIIVQKIRFREVGRPGVATLVFASDTGTYIEQQH